jgi:pimeloyl-ACP methyl ester carboxylesterase
VKNRAAKLRCNFYIYRQIRVLKILGAIVGILIVVLVAAWITLRDIPYETLEAKYTDSASHFVDLPGGFHVHYQDEGDPGLPPLLLLHGFGDSFTSWEAWVRELKPRFRVISLDFPGHGLTRAPEGYVLGGEGLADFVDAFAAQLALPKFAVAGNSMGGGAAWQLAVRHRWADFQRSPGHRAILMALNPRAQRQATPELLGTIKVPTLVLHGESDVLIEPASARKFSAAIAGAKLITYPHVGHLPQIEIPQRSASDAAAFLETQPLPS